MKYIGLHNSYTPFDIRTCLVKLMSWCLSNILRSILSIDRIYKQDETINRFTCHELKIAENSLPFSAILISPSEVLQPLMDL